MTALLALACLGPASLVVPSDRPAEDDSVPMLHSEDTGDSDTSPPEDTGPFDRDGDGSPAAEDCDDDDPTRYPGAHEVCDGVDADCDGVPDDADAEDRRTFYRDADGDGYGDPTRPQTACAAPNGFVADASDCDDGDKGIHPGADEGEPDGVDNDCDGKTDEDWSCLAEGGGMVSSVAPSVSLSRGGTTNAGTVEGGMWVCAATCDTAAAAVYLAASDSCGTPAVLPMGTGWGTSWRVCVYGQQVGSATCTVTTSAGDVALSVTVR